MVMAGRYRRPTTSEQREKATRAREAKLAAAHQTLTEQVTPLATGPQWQAWLDVAARFHHYSFNNTVLLLAQNPTPSRSPATPCGSSSAARSARAKRALVVLTPVTRRFNDDP
jgi:hypothetical protein